MKHKVISHKEFEFAEIEPGLFRLPTGEIGFVDVAPSKETMTLHYDDEDAQTGVIHLTTYQQFSVTKLNLAFVEMLEQDHQKEKRSNIILAAKSGGLLISGLAMDYFFKVLLFSPAVLIGGLGVNGYAYLQYQKAKDQIQTLTDLYEKYAPKTIK